MFLDLLLGLGLHNLNLFSAPAPGPQVISAPPAPEHWFYTTHSRLKIIPSRRQIFLRTVDLRMTQSPVFTLYAGLFEYSELYWSFDELSWNETPHRQQFFKILFDNTDENKKNPSNLIYLGLS